MVVALTSSGADGILRQNIFGPSCVYTTVRRRVGAVNCGEIAAKGEKKMKSLVMVAAAALCCAALAEGDECAKREGGRRGGFQKGDMPMMDPVVRIATNPKMAEKLGLTDEQKAKLKEIKSCGKNDEKRDKVRAASEKLLELMKADKIDEAAVMKATDEVFDLRKGMAKDQARRIIAVKSILTPEQIAKAREAIKNLDAARGEKGQRRGPRKGPGKGGRGPAPKPDNE